MNPFDQDSAIPHAGHPWGMMGNLKNSNKRHSSGFHRLDTNKIPHSGFIFRGEFLLSVSSFALQNSHRSVSATGSKPETNSNATY